MENGYLNIIQSVNQNTKDISSLNDWWEKHHQDGNELLITGSDGFDVWQKLNISHFINSNSKILNIGVGTGKCTFQLNKIGVDVSVLDISQTAIEKVKLYSNNGYNANQLETLPENYFDLAISNLVAQHMSNENLIKQIYFVLKSLKVTGFLAIQFAFSYIDINPNDADFNTQKWGGVGRTITQIEKIVNQAGGEIVWIEEIGDYPLEKSGWFGVHIVKDNLKSKSNYFEKRNYLQKSLLTETHADKAFGLTKVSEAIQLYLESVNYFPENFQVNFKLGQIFFANNSLKEAFEYTLKSFQLFKISTEYWSLLIEIIEKAIEQKQYDFAEKSLLKLLEIRRNEIEILINLGVVSYLSNKVEKSKAYFLRILEFDVTNEIALFNLNEIDTMEKLENV